MCLPDRREERRRRIGYNRKDIYGYQKTTRHIHSLRNVSHTQMIPKEEESDIGEKFGNSINIYK